MNPFALDEPLVLRDSDLGRMSDDEFFNFCQSNRKWRIERNAQHDILLMAPAFTLTGRRNASLIGQLYAWWNHHGEPGFVFDSNAGFTLTNDAVRSPDASWVSAQRWNALTPAQQEKFATVCPEFVVELRSKTDSLRVLLEKWRNTAKTARCWAGCSRATTSRPMFFALGRKVTKPWKASTAS